MNQPEESLCERMDNFLKINNKDRNTEPFPSPFKDAK